MKSRSTSARSGFFHARSSIRQVRKKYRGSPSRGSGLSQSQITGDEEHHHNNAHNVENTVHVSSSFLFRVIGLPLSQMSYRPMRLKGISSSVKLFGSGSCISSIVQTFSVTPSATSSSFGHKQRSIADCLTKCALCRSYRVRPAVRGSRFVSSWDSPKGLLRRDCGVAAGLPYPLESAS